MTAQNTKHDRIVMNIITDVRWEPAEGRYVARCEEFPHLQGLGRTPRAAAEELYVVLKYWVHMMKPTKGGQ